jgi:hypothetical protein
LQAVERPDLTRAALEIRDMTPGRRWKFRRDLVIYLAASRGASQRMLADVFDLPHSRISAILKTMREKFQHD